MWRAVPNAWRRPSPCLRLEVNLENDLTQLMRSKQYLLYLASHLSLWTGLSSTNNNVHDRHTLLALLIVGPGSCNLWQLRHSREAERPKQSHSLLAQSFQRKHSRHWISLIICFARVVWPVVHATPKVLDRATACDQSRTPSSYYVVNASVDPGSAALPLCSAWTCNNHMADSPVLLRVEPWVRP
jgi:hypothetical protein